MLVSPAGTFGQPWLTQDAAARTEAAAQETAAKSVSSEKRQSSLQSALEWIGLSPRAAAAQRAAPTPAEDVVNLPTAFEAPAGAYGQPWLNEQLTKSIPAGSFGQPWLAQQDAMAHGAAPSA